MTISFELEGELQIFGSVNASQIFTVTENTLFLGISRTMMTFPATGSLCTILGGASDERLTSYTPTDAAVSRVTVRTNVEETATVRITGAFKQKNTNHR